jgi:NADPH:quinone reductase-like Zn-dependent oxidoreductase
LARKGPGIIQVGEKVEDLKPGDHVLFITCLGTMAFRSYVRRDQRFVTMIPTEIPLAVAAGLPLVFSAVIYSLNHAGKLIAGGKILIHAAAGGVGQAANQYAKFTGAEVFTTVSNEEKKNLLMEVYDIAEDHIFSSRDLSFAKGIMRMTKGEGVDMIFNCLHGEALQRSWECIAPFGQFVEIGKRDLISGGKLDMSPLRRNASIIDIDLAAIMRYKPDVIRDTLKEIIYLWAQGKIHAVRPLTVLGFTQLEHGFRQLQSGKNMGKIVFVPHDKDIVPMTPVISTPFTFEANATYVLAGGLGGIGRSLAEWMASRGAKRIAFLSRSGKVTKKVEGTIALLVRRGCDYQIFKADITKKGQPNSAFNECREKMPPIRGGAYSALWLLR